MFDVGGVFASPNILSFLAWESIYSLVERHSKGDHGEITEEQRELNANRIAGTIKKGRIRSRYLVNGWWVLVSTRLGIHTNVLFEHERHRWKKV